jgi:hypothetical protein
MPKHRVKHFLFCKQNAEKKLLRNLCSAIRLEKIARTYAKKNKSSITTSFQIFYGSFDNQLHLN